MAVLTEGRHAAAFVLTEGNGSISRDTITILSGAGKISPGTVLGKVTASGKYKPATATGTDGAEKGAALNLYEVDATSADVQVAAIARHAEVNSNILSYDATVNDAAKKSAKNADLAALGIIVR